MTDLLGPANAPNAVTQEPPDSRVFGVDDTYFKDCSSPGAGDGTKISASFLNGLLKQVRRAIRGMGVAVNNDDDDMLLKALQKAGTGYVPLADARMLLPIYPEIETASSKLSATLGSGQVVLDPNQTFTHRGIVRISTSTFDVAQRTFATIASKTFHWRWHAPGTGDATPAASWPNGRLVLKDLANASYNPAAAAETDPRFDSTYDDMLIGRVITNASNVPTLRLLENRHRLMGRATQAGTVSNSGNNDAETTVAFTIDCARTPLVTPWEERGTGTAATSPDNDTILIVQSMSRYGFNVYRRHDHATAITVGAVWQA